MKPLVVDCETTFFMKGNPYSECNKLCYVGCFDGNNSSLHRLDFGLHPYGDERLRALERISHYNLFVAFNSKFDIAWLRRYGLHTEHLACWDLQLVDFIITGQQTPFPSLDSVCDRCGIRGKSDDLNTKYWSQGIDTTEIPEQELRDYLEGDLKAEWALFQWQMKYLEDNPQLKRLCWDACQDLLVTQEMETNGLYFDFALSKELGDGISRRIQELDKLLVQCVTQPVGNWNSNDWISAILYGGTCLLDIQEEFEYEYKDGRVVTKTRKGKLPVTFPRLVEPLKGTALKKAGFWEVNEDVLHKLKATGVAKKIIGLLLERNKLEKLVGTYFYGWPKLYEEYQWTANIIHGHLNHAVARTGRLSSSQPNQQNTDPELRRCIKTRFPIQSSIQ